MRKITGLLLLLATTISTAVFSQKEEKLYFGKNIYFNFISTDIRMNTRGPVTYSAEDTRIYSALNYLRRPSGVHVKVTPVSPIILGVKLTDSLTDYYGAGITVLSKIYQSYIIKDTSSAILVALGITKQNVKDYRYRVIEDDTVERVRWSPIPLSQNYGAKEPYGFIGKFKAPGKQLLVEVQNIKEFKISDGVVFDWRNDSKPVTTELLVELPYNGTDRIEYFNINHLGLNKGYATQFDKKTGLPLDFKFPVGSVSNLRLSLKSHLTIPYAIYMIKNTGDRIDTAYVENYLLNNFLGNYIDIDSRHFNQAGKYELIIQRNARLGYWPEDQVLRIPFTVQPLPSLEKRASLRQALPYLIAAIVAVGLLFWFYRRRTKVRLALSAQARQNTNLKLRSIRAQLNPHFMFNALTSIQNLVNKHDMEGANHYLSHFADLTRKVLNTGDRDLISLEDEIKILDDYLQMEQLRFNFKYKLELGADVNAANIEVPPMLLQPFVENGIKHGISNLRENGLINVSIQIQGNDLVFSITDNGPGFKQNDTMNSNGSYGLRLSEERLQLLNEVYKQQPAKLDVQSDGSGTRITITLMNWIS
ncbi:MAG: histidine kinase [Pedobacter sp.]